MVDNRRQSGITLISILIASAILVVLSTYIAMVLFDIANFDIRSQSDQYISANSRFIVAKIKQDIRQASSVNQPEPGQAGSLLDLTVDGENISYQVKNSRLIRTDNQGEAAVSTNLVKIDDFQVSLVDNQSDDTDLPVVDLNMDVVWAGELGEGKVKEININSSIGLRQ